MTSLVSARGLSRRVIVTQALPCVATLWVLSRLAAGFDAPDTRAVLRLMGEISALQWALALAFSALSYAALGRYDRAVHGWLGTGISSRAAQQSGLAAIAISQTAGLGLLTGTLVRWYLLRELSFLRAAAVTGLVGGSFLAGYAVLAAAAVLVAAPQVPGLRALALATLAAAVLLPLACLALPRGRLPLPALGRIGTVLGLVAIDVLAAALAFAALLGTADPTLLAGAVLALGAGIVSATPAGIGGFDAVLMALAPDHAVETLLCATVAFRLVYFALPACLAAGAILLRDRLFAASPRAPAAEIATPAPDRLCADLPATARAEAWLALQPGNAALLSPAGRLVAPLRPARNSLILLGDPLTATGLSDLVARAQTEGRAAFAWKLSARHAAPLRRAGWRVLRCGDEIVLDPRAFTPDTPPRRQLRRKLRKAGTAGLTITRATPRDIAALAAIDTAWRARRGPARGATMGRFYPATLAHQRVFTAIHAGRPVAFCSFHATRAEWTLDLLRTTDDAPDGTMHALLVHAIGTAAAEGLPRLSLAAVPALALPGRLAAAHFAELSGADGLRQFKAAFAPRWEPRFAAAPSRAALAVGLADLAREITASDE